MTIFGHALGLISKLSKQCQEWQHILEAVQQAWSIERDKNHELLSTKVSYQGNASLWYVRYVTPHFTMSTSTTLCTYTHTPHYPLHTHTIPHYPCTLPYAHTLCTHTPHYAVHTHYTMLCLPICRNSKWLHFALTMRN